MAQKESAHREIVDDLSGQLKQLRREHDTLTTLSRDQVSLQSSLRYRTALIRNHRR
jgi:hypothetical protein